MYHTTDSEKTVCTCHGSQNCTLCGNSYRNIAFKGGYICENCVDFIKSRTPDVTLK